MGCAIVQRRIDIGIRDSECGMDRVIECVLAVDIPGVGLWQSDGDDVGGRKHLNIVKISYIDVHERRHHKNHIGVTTGRYRSIIDGKRRCMDYMGCAIGQCRIDIGIRDSKRVLVSVIGCVLAVSLTVVRFG